MQKKKYEKPVVTHLGEERVHEAGLVAVVVVVAAVVAPD
ncbi:hypothetical protein CDLVIII_5308 [Clostridium sp. DL-VIII]|nr:hypothetical protein CDLVIII_5308 [Clostridium sp. DL-VIII]